MEPRSLALWIVPFFPSGCAPSAVGTGDYELRGSIVDDETGAPVNREDVRVFVSCEAQDASDHTVQPPRRGQSTFAVRMPLARVRLSVHDGDDYYRAYEKTIEVPRSGIVCEVRLVPHRYIVLSGKVLVERAGAWVPMAPPEPLEYPAPPPGGYPVLSFRWESKGTGFYGSPIDTNGAYEVRLPCELVMVSPLDSSMIPEPKLIDLTGVTAERVERDIRLTPEPLEVSSPEHEARLDPARFIELRGRLIVQQETSWVPLTPEIADRYGKPDCDLGFGLDCQHDGYWSTTRHPDGSFEVRVPRDRLRMYTLNTELEPVPQVLDLTGATGDLVERNIQMVRHGRSR